MAFSQLSQKIKDLVIHVPRPADNYVIVEHLDPNNYLGRTSRQGSRNWPKFVRYICWQVVLRGFFQYPLGFGVFGDEGEGQDELFQFYRLLAKPSPDGACLATTPFSIIRTNH
jgi:hypothetical protein